MIISDQNKNKLNQQCSFKNGDFTFLKSHSLSWAKIKNNMANTVLLMALYFQLSFVLTFDYSKAAVTTVLQLT